MRIAVNITVSVMFAMYGHPLFGYHACGEPQPGTHKMFKYGMKFYASMSLATMQIQRDTDDSNVRHYQYCD
jgi:hypothetical protein